MVGKKVVVMSGIMLCINGIVPVVAMELTIKTDDDKTAFIDASLVESKTLSSMMTDITDNDATQEPISLPISSSTLGIVQELGAVLANASEKEEQKEYQFKKATELLHNKDLSLDDLVALLNAANYLDSEKILRVASKEISNALRHKFNIVGILGMLNTVKELNLAPELSEIIGGMIAQEYALTQDYNLPQLLRHEIQNNPPSYFAFSDDKSLIALGIKNCSKILIWNVLEDAMVAELPSRACVTALSFSPSKHELAVAAEDKTVKFWNLSSLKYRLLPLRQVVHLLSFSPDGEQLITSLHQDSGWNIRVWDVASFENSKSYHANRRVLFNESGELISDMTPAYKRIIRKWYITYPALSQELRHLTIENALIFRWILEMIVNDKKIYVAKQSALAKDAIKNFVSDKPVLKKILQPFIVCEKSWCSIS